MKAMSKHLNRLSEKITLLLNDVSLKAKVLIVFAICVVLPVALSCVIFSAYLNKYFCEREMESIEYAAERGYGNEFLLFSHIYVGLETYRTLAVFPLIDTLPRIAGRSEGNQIFRRGYTARIGGGNTEREP